MHVVFVLPKISRFPIGGYKMVYEYSNRLVDKGFEVSILHMNNGFMKKYRIPSLIRNILSKFYTFLQPNWFCLNGKIHKLSIFDYSKDIDYINPDFAIATDISTVSFTNEKFTCEKVYYIQGYENWDATEEDLIKSYSNKMKKIVIAKWLKDIVDQYSPEPSILIRNAIDTDVYHEIIPWEDRMEYSISILYNELPTKGFEYAYKSIYKLKELYPQLIVNMFGRTKFPHTLPNWIIYHENANQKETVNIYNNSRVFLCASIEEGYGLTGLESMACGCVLVSSRYKGVLEYADNNSAVLVPVMDVDALVEGVKKVFNDEIDINLRKSSRMRVNDLTWEQSMNKFCEVLTKH